MPLKFIQGYSSLLLFQLVSDNCSLFFFKTLVSVKVWCCFSFWRTKPQRCIFNLPAQCFPDILNQGLLPRFTFSPDHHTPSHSQLKAITDPSKDPGVVLTALFLLSFLYSMSQHGNLHLPLLHCPRERPIVQVWEGLADFKAYLRGKKKKSLFLSIGRVIEHRFWFSSLHLSLVFQGRVTPGAFLWILTHAPGSFSLYKKLDQEAKATASPGCWVIFQNVRHVSINPGQNSCTTSHWPT